MRNRVNYLNRYFVVLLLLICLCILSQRKGRLENIAVKSIQIYDLQRYPLYDDNTTSGICSLDFSYMSSDNQNLKTLREKYHLKEIAGKGSETEQIVNLMEWVYSLARHANEPAIPDSRDAMEFINMAVQEGKQLNCYMKTVILNEVYLSLGFKSRHTHLLPLTSERYESHYVTSVYSKELGKWVMMDPDFGLYLTDEENELLGIPEIRDRLVNGQKCRLKHVGRGIKRTEVCHFFINWLDGTDYLWFLSKFLVKYRCPPDSSFGQDNKEYRHFIELLPGGLNDQLTGTTDTLPNNCVIYYTNCLKDFWN